MNIKRIIINQTDDNILQKLLKIIRVFPILVFGINHLKRKQNKNLKNN